MTIASAHWGDCNLDYPVEKIVSPYPYKTAAEHYNALMAEAKKAGGPTVHTRQTLPDWDGWYQRGGRDDQWIWGRNLQAATMISLLTPEYQKRMVQMNYHEAVSNSPQWMASFCYPEGFMRWWSEASLGGPIEVMMTPNQVQFLSGIADNFLRRVLVGRTHVQKVPQWYGETVGFWNGNTLVAWTANVQGWTLSHSMFEFSNKMEIDRSVHAERRRQDDDGRDHVLRSRSVHAAAAHGHAMGRTAAARRSADSASRSSSAACRARSSTVPTAGQRS